jgi:hypothetical protein
MITHKLVLLVGVYTGLRSETIANLQWRHLDTKQEEPRIFVDYETKTDQGATGTWFAFPRKVNEPALDTLLLFNKYRSIIAKKNADLLEGRLWVRMDGSKGKDGDMKVIRQWRGKEWIAGVAKIVATWLGLPESEKYTGHTFRRTCAQWAADSGMTETQMQHHFGWKSTSMIQCYSRSSKKLKIDAASSLNLEAEDSHDEKTNMEKRHDAAVSGQGSINQVTKLNTVEQTHFNGLDAKRPDRAYRSASGASACELTFSCAEQQNILETPNRDAVPFYGVQGRGAPSAFNFPGSNVVINVYNSPSQSISPSTTFPTAATPPLMETTKQLQRTKQAYKVKLICKPDYEDIQ